MQAHAASLFNSICLIGLGLWGYFATGQAPTALIPVVFGAILLLLNPGVRKENKVIAHIAVVLTLLILLGLAKPFMSAVSDGRSIAMVRVGVMIFTTILAMVAFIQSFRQARKNRQ